MKFLIFASFLFIGLSCQKFGDLKGTQWELAGYADVQTGEFIIEESSDQCRAGKHCNTLTFYKRGGGVLWVQQASYIEVNLLDKSFFGFDDKLGVEAGHLRLFYRAKNEYGIDSFEYTEDEFKIFYNNKQNYLLFKRIKP